MQTLGMTETHFVMAYLVLTGVIALVAAFSRRDGMAQGIWGWGVIAASMGLAAVLLVAFGQPEGVYGRFKESSSAIGAVIAASVLAWSWFFQTDDKSVTKNQIGEILGRVRAIQKKLDDKSN
jgi:hypothetical protein